MRGLENGPQFIYDEAAVVVATHLGKFLAVGDVHLGIEENLVKKGVHLYDHTDAIVKKLVRLLGEFGTRNLLILGDVKNSILYPDAFERAALEEFFGGLKSYNVQVTAGNHDGHLAEIVDLNPVEEFIIDGFAFMHGHRWPSEKAMNCDFIFAGHNHAAVSLLDRNGAVYTQKAWMVAKIDGGEAKKKYKAFNPKARLVILPAFNDLIMGTPVNKISEDNLSPLLRNGVFNYKNADVYSLRGELVGTPETIGYKEDR